MGNAVWESRRTPIGTQLVHASLRAEALEVADEEHAEVDPRRDGRTAVGLRAVAFARVLGEGGEAPGGEDGVQAGRTVARATRCEQRGPKGAAGAAALASPSTCCVLRALRGVI